MRTFMRQKNLWMGCLLLGIGILASPPGCSEADSLGDEKPDEVQLSSTPTWENGVKDLVQMKCAVCHTVPPNDLTPDNAPIDLDLRSYASTESVRGADALGSWINAGILEGGVDDVPQMPLNYSTPLTTQEIAGLKTWVSLGLPENDEDLNATDTGADESSSTTNTTTETPTGDIANGKTLYTSLCKTCHGSTGQGGRGPTLKGCSVCGSLSSLMSKIETDMPLTDPSSCDAECAEDVAAYILDEFN